jgi:hypothetical protein
MKSKVAIIFLAGVVGFVGLLFGQIIPTQPLPVQWVDQSKSNSLRLLSTVTGPRFQIVRGRSQQLAIDTDASGWIIRNGLVTRFGGTGDGSNVVALIDEALSGTPGFLAVFVDTNKIATGPVYYSTNGNLYFIGHNADTSSVFVVANISDLTKNLESGIDADGKGFLRQSNGLTFTSSNFTFRGSNVTITNNDNIVTLTFQTSNHTATVGIDTTSGQVEVISDNGVVLNSGSGSTLINAGAPWQFLGNTLSLPSGTEGSTSLGLSPDSSAYLMLRASDPTGYALQQFANTNGALTSLVGSSPFGGLFSTTGNQMDFGVNGGQVSFTSAAFRPGTSNTVDSGVSVVPWRTNYSETLRTGDPGSGRAAWQMGKAITGVSVALVVTNYIEVKIDGVVRRLALVQ